MKYVYTGGKYAEFRGYVFVNGKPTTILDRGALEAISKRPDFKEAKDEQKKVEAPAAPAVLKRQTLTVKRK